VNRNNPEYKGGFLIMRGRICLLATLVAVLLVGGTYGVVQAASPPVPSYGSAVVDGNPSEWVLSNDLFAEMYNAGNPDPDFSGFAVYSKLYLRYDCDNKLLYVLVLVEDNYDGLMDAGEAWIKIYKLGNSARTWSEFAWVEADATAGTVRGYEASTYLEPGAYTTEKIEVHIQVAPDETSSTGRPLEHRIGLQIVCVGATPTPTPQVPGMTGWGIMAAAIMLGVLISLVLRRRRLASTGR